MAEYTAEIDAEVRLHLKRAKNRIRRAEKALPVLDPTPPAPTGKMTIGYTADRPDLWEAEYGSIVGNLRRFNGNFPDQPNQLAAWPWLDGQREVYQSIKIHGNELKAVGQPGSAAHAKLVALIRNTKIQRPAGRVKWAVDHEPERDGSFPQGRWDLDDWTAAQVALADIVEAVNAEFPDTPAYGMFTCHVPWTVVNKNRWGYVTAAVALATGKPHVEVGFDPYITTGSFTQGPIETCIQIMDQLGYDYRNEGWSVNEFGFDGQTPQQKAVLLAEWFDFGIAHEALAMSYFLVVHQGTDWTAGMDDPAVVAVWEEYLPEQPHPTP